MSNAIRDDFQAILATATPPELGPQQRAERESRAALDRKLETLRAAHQIDPASAQSLRALALLWHDHLDESHSISQQIHGADGSFLHGIMHRRQPDYSNAKYWFDRVGGHPCFPEIAGEAAALIEQAARDDLLEKLAPGGRWDPFAFIDACENAVESGAPATVELLKQIQAVEFRALLGHLLKKFGA